MQIICRMSGSILTLAAFPGLKVQNLHPLFTMPLNALHKAASQQNTTDAENALLFLAYMNASRHVQWPAPLPASKLPAESVTQWLPRMVPIIGTIALSEGNGVFPRFSTAPETTFTDCCHWLELCEEIIQHGRTKSARAIANDSRAVSRAKSIRKRAADNAAASLQVWALSYLHRDAEWQALDQSSKRAREKLFIAAFATNSQEPIANLQYIREQCLLKLPEQNETTASTKRAVLQRIETNIIQRIDFLQIMGMDDGNSNALLSEIGANYAIQLEEGEEHINTATPAGKALAAIISAPERPAMPKGVEVDSTLAGTAEPQRHKFHNALAYSIALTKWRKANENA